MKYKLFIIAMLATIVAFGQDTHEKLTVEPNHSTVGFAIPVAGITRVTGKFMTFDMKLDLRNRDLVQSTVTFTIETISINTGIDDRDKSLQDERFFYSEKYPQITFTSSRIKRKGKGYLVEGVLRMRDVEKKVALPVTAIWIAGELKGIQIRWELNRTDYGVGNTFKHTIVSNFLGEIISIELDLSVRRDKRD
jgi:polyisoprenoid-binding protein YceI